MFYNCTKLNYIKALFTTTPSSSYTSNWIYGVSSTGTFVKSKDATWNTTPGALSTKGVPAGWTVITDGEESGGGVKLISFTIFEGIVGDSKVEYNAEEGMTWSQWVDSEYNTRGYYIESDKIKIKPGFVICFEDDGIYVRANEIITISKNYVWN